MITSILQLFDLSFILNMFQQSTDAPIEAIRLFDIKLINPTDFWNLILRFGLNLSITIVLIRVIYYKSNKRKDYFFIYFLMNMIIFMICIMLKNVPVELGFALGLFAIFGIIRYRTDPIPIKEMTYLFLVVGLAIINALANKKVSYAELLFTNFAILGITWYLESIWMSKQLEIVRINYEKIELIHPDREAELIEDLRQRTGLDVKSVSVSRINYMRDTARLMVSFKPKG
jgi:hypothetical protein